MTGGGDSFRAVAGGPAHHIPVLGSRVVEYLNPQAGKTYIDATFGAGGYSRLVLALGSRVLGIDRDQSAVANGMGLVEASGGRLTLTEDTFSNLEDVIGVEQVDGLMFDLGVSSMQFDQAARGFSFRHQGPLDMRMGGEGSSAADLIAVADEPDLAAIIATLGEERHARAVARAIVKARSEHAITTTTQLADIVASVVRSKPGDIHPATRTFQALRIFINDELGELVKALAASERVLKEGGRLVVVSFHSLEDRIVKSFLSERSATRGGSRHAPEVSRVAPTFTILTKRPVTADDAEVSANPRARSAKLRAAERTAAPPRKTMPELLPPLPSLADVMRGR
ncbi:MAG: 16S rRNA (cytosine(1402)-N(4))-methyltransferase RsmH [Pseudolabrys sp.]|nr:16S rRNA (cytosine(1402)-N(4))-methyltransferase RsmH [Pseudolabrys sp.]